MKILKNESTSITKSNKDDETMDFKDLIMVCLNNPLKEGFSFEDFQKRDRIEKSMTGKEFKFEDSDAKNLKLVVSLMRWNVRHQDIMKFCAKINDL